MKQKQRKQQNKYKQSWFFEKVNKTGKPLARQREKTQNLQQSYRNQVW